MDYWLLTVNPGSSSTKLGLFQGDKLAAATTLRHLPSELAPRVSAQLDFRTGLVARWLESVVSPGSLSAIVGRGGLLKPVASGTYTVNEAMRQDMLRGAQGQHASNLGGLVAHALAIKLGIPAFIVDPVSVDELIPEARISGLPEIERRSLSHALNIRAIARRAASDLAADFAKVNLVLAHLGGGISVAPLAGGRLLDVNNANEMGPFSPERSGGLPAGDLAALCFLPGATEYDLRRRLTQRGGLTAYLASGDGLAIEGRIAAGDERAKFYYHSLAYQVAKEIGAMATVLGGKVRAIVITGGLACSKMLTDWLSGYVSFIAPVMLYPGEDELLALAQGGLRVLRGEEQSQEYV